MIKTLSSIIYHRTDPLHVLSKIYEHIGCGVRTRRGARATVPAPSEAATGYIRQGESVRGWSGRAG